MENQPPKTERIEIRPMGSYFEVDTEGYVVNPASLENIQPEWKPLVDDIVETYKAVYGAYLTQVYARGPGAKGQAVRGVSDIDTFAYVDQSPEYVRENGISDELQKALEEKYDFVQGIEMSVSSLDQVSDKRIILNQSVCVYGEPIEVTKLKPGKEMAIHAPALHKRMARFEGFLERGDIPDDEMKDRCVWFMKTFLRVGFELTMDREHKYTRDLYPCYETFAKYYPEHEPEMRRALDLVLNPTADKQEMKKVMDTLGQWLVSEVPKYFEVRE